MKHKIPTTWDLIQLAEATNCLPVLEELLKHTDPGVRGSALLNLVGHENQAYVRELLIKLLEVETSQSIRIVAQDHLEDPT